MKTNSEKIKKILSGGNHVKITRWDGNDWDDYSDIVYDYDDDEQCFYIQNDWRTYECIDEDIYKIEAVYMKPIIKKGNLVKIYEDFLKESGYFYGNEKNIWHVDSVLYEHLILRYPSTKDQYIKAPFWAVSHYVQTDEEIQQQINEAKETEDLRVVYRTKDTDCGTERVLVEINSKSPDRILKIINKELGNQD